MRSASVLHSGCAAPIVSSAGIMRGESLQAQPAACTASAVRMAVIVVVAAGRKSRSRVGRRPRKAARRLTRAAWARTPAATASSTGSAAAGTGKACGGGGADHRAEAHQGQPARHPAARLAAEQRPGGQAFSERVCGQCQRDRGRSCQRDGGALQEPVDRQCRRRARAAGLLLMFLAAAPGAGGQARGREPGDRCHRHQPGPDPRGTGARPCIGEQVQPRDDEQRARGGREPDLPLTGAAAGQPRPGHGRGRHQAGTGQHRAGQHGRDGRPGGWLDGMNNHRVALHHR